MMRRDGRGRVIDTRRNINTEVGGQLLIGDGWEAVAHAELTRLAVEIGIYHQQLKGSAGYAQTGRAIVALEKACDAISEAGKWSEIEDRDR